VFEANHLPQSSHHFFHIGKKVYSLTRLQTGLKVQFQDFGY